jgi:hypothetical protein
MSTVKVSYATATAITCSMASKTSGQGRRSAAVDNSSNLYVDALILGSLTIGTFTSPASWPMYGFASADDGTTYETGGSTDADWNTIRGDEKPLGPPVAAYTNTTAFAGVFTLAAAYRGVAPRNWGIIISQTNCGTLSATEGNHLKKFEGIYLTAA